jgi:CHAD domain-containing protein
VYFPNGLHAARIALKKLRYALEIADATAIVHPREAIRDLKKMQDLLGELHDRQTLIASFRLAKIPADGSSARDGLHVVVNLLEAEIGDLHARYLTRRDRLLEICNDAERLRRTQRTSSPLTVAAGAASAAGALAISSAVVAAARRCALPAVVSH